MDKLLPIGISDFKKLIQGGYAYVDKTLLIQELIEKGTDVALIPRMRRFGKTLNLSMLRYFFEKGSEETADLFRNLAIWKIEKYRALQGQFPVIFISLKDIKYSSWEETFSALRRVIAGEFQRHGYLSDENFLSPKENDLYSKILAEESDSVLTAGSLQLLTAWLYRYHKKRVILLIDEYDTPAHSAYVGGFYEPLISFLRNWLSGGFKDNESLERGVLTGILRIAKETIFSGLNNVSVFTVLSEEFQDKFGLLESEVRELLSQCGIAEEKLAEISQWYDGYRIGSCQGLYNPWSVLNCIAKKGALSPYWVNTSDNALMKQLIAKGSDALKADVEHLLQGKPVEKTIEEGIVFSALERNSETVWSLLLFSGYLTIDKTPSYGIPCRLKIPNLEVGELYKTLIVDWFKNSIEEHNYRMLLNSLTSGDVTTFTQLFQSFMLSSASMFDMTGEAPEKIYHAFVLGILIGLEGRYEVKSNRESGYGRYDVCLIPKDIQDLGVVLEFKKVGTTEKLSLEKAAQEALKQIEEKLYDQELVSRGVSRILHLGLAFQGKRVAIRSRTAVLVEKERISDFFSSQQGKNLQLSDY